MRSTGLRYSLIGLVLVLVSAGGGFVLAGALDDDGTTAETTEDTSASTVPDDGAGPTTPASGVDGPAIVASQLGLLGWWDGERWVRNDGAPAPAEAGLAFTYVPLDGPVRAATGGPLSSTCDIVEAIPFVELDPPFADLGDEPTPTVAVSGVADPLPRRVEPLDRSSATYRTAAREALATVDITDPEPEITQLLRIDLDGDGSDEVLITAEQRSSDELTEARAGDYSAVIVRRLVGGVVRAQVLVHDLAVDDDEAELAFAFLTAHRIAGVADLNGDGRLEVIEYSHYYEGSGLTAYAVGPDGELDDVLAVGCGV